MRAFLLVPLAILLCGCPPPMFSQLQRESPVVPTSEPKRPHSASVMDQPPCPPLTDSTSVWRVSCTPDEFNIHVASRQPDRIDVRLLDGQVVHGRSMFVRDDTAFVGRRAVSMASVDNLWLIENRDLGSRATVVGASAGAVAGVGAVLGLIGGAANPEREIGEATLTGLAGGSIVGLGFGLMLDAIEPRERFVVSGWHDPALAPGYPGLLVANDADIRRPRWAQDTGIVCGETIPPDAGYISRCTTRDQLTTRSGADWVDEVHLRLRDGGHVQGRDLVVSDTEISLDGIRRPLAGVNQVELRSVGGPWSIVRPAAKGALAGIGYGLVLGAGVALATGDTDAVWAVPTGLGTFFGTTGLTLGLARGRVRVRDVTIVPASGP